MRGASTPRVAQHAPSGSWGWPVVIVALVCLSFWPVLGNEFVNWDDPSYFLQNLRYRGLSPAHVRWMFTTLDFSHYQPLTWVTHGLVYTLWGMDPTGYHLGNLLLHTANAVLFYILIIELSGSYGAAAHPAAARGAAAVGALFFALHPLRVEAVAWATERQEVLCAFFALLSLVAYVRMSRAAPGSRVRHTWYTLSLGSFVLSLLSKAAGMMLPLVLLALDVYPLQRHVGRGRDARLRIIAEKAPYLLVAGAAALLGFYAKQSFFLRPMTQHGILERIVQSAYGLCFYIWKTLLPVNLSPLYLLERPLQPDDPIYLVSVVVVVAITTAVIVAQRRWPWAVLAWACYALILFPVLGITQAGPQKVADRYTYLGCLPWAVLAAAGVQRVWERWEMGRLTTAVAGTLAGGVAAILLMLGVLTFMQARVWHDSVSLWDRAAHVEPDNYIAYNNRGTGRRLQQDLSGALMDFDQAVRLRPLYWDARVNRAWARRTTGDLDGAIADYTELMRQNPRYTRGYNSRGLARQAKGDVHGAIADYTTALASAPPGSALRADLERNLAAARQLAAHPPQP